MKSSKSAKKTKVKDIVKDLNTDTDDSEINPLKVPVSAHSQRIVPLSHKCTKDGVSKRLNLSSSDDNWDETMEEVSSSDESIKDENSKKSSCTSSEILKSASECNKVDNSNESSSDVDEDLRNIVQSVQREQLNLSTIHNKLITPIKRGNNNETLKSEVSTLAQLGTSGLFFSPLRTPQVEKSDEKTKRKHPIETFANIEDSSDSNNETMERKSEDLKLVKKEVRFQTPPDYKLAEFDQQDIFKEDMTNKELWLVKVPDDLSLSSLDAKTAVVGATVSLDKRGKQQNGINKLLFNWHMTTDDYQNQRECPFTVLLPAKFTKAPKYAGKLKGEITIKKKISTPKPKFKDVTVKKHDVPEGLKMRNIPFGAEYSSTRIPDEASAKSSSNKNTREKLKLKKPANVDLSTSVHTSDIKVFDDKIPGESSQLVPRKQKKKKHKKDCKGEEVDRQQSFVNVLDPSKESTTSSSKKKKKKKRKSSDNELDTAATNSSHTEPVKIIPHSKILCSEMDIEATDMDNSSIVKKKRLDTIQNENINDSIWTKKLPDTLQHENANVSISTEVKEEHLKKSGLKSSSKKKKKKKSKDMDMDNACLKADDCEEGKLLITSSDSHVSGQSSKRKFDIICDDLQPSLNEFTGVKKGKKKKHKDKKKDL